MAALRSTARWIGRAVSGFARPLRRVRPTIRLRLALLYGGLVLLAGVVLLAVTYTLVASRRALTLIWTNKGLPNPAQGTPTFPKSGFVLHFQWGALPLPKSLPPGKLQDILHQTVSYQQAVDMHQLLTQGSLALAVVAVLALVAGWLVAGRILRPLQVMTTTARRLSSESPGGRIGLVGPRDELKNLADTFDALLDRLDAALAAEKRFVANVSHELRTPLAIQKTLLEVGLSDPHADVESLRKMAGQIWDVNQRSRRLIDGLLELARSEQGVQVRESVNLASVVHDAIEAALPEATTLGLRMEPRLQTVTVRGDRVLLERMAGNLIENAVRYNIAEGWLEVETRAEGDRAILTVVNTGPVFEQSEVAALFEPFRRGVQERTNSARGAGLGLSIVRAVAAAHRGTVQATARPEGGLLVAVTLPVE